MTIEEVLPDMASCRACKLRNGCSQVVPTAGNLINPILMIVGDYPGQSEDECGEPFCIEETSRVLMADLTWVAIGSLKVGDLILACDEEGAPGWTGISQTASRKWRIATVDAVYKSQKECVKLITEKGDLMLTMDHRVLTMDAWRNKRWLRVDQLCPNGGIGKRASSLCHLFTPWEQNVNYDAAWLAGFFDGEGWTSKKAKKKRTGFCQNSGFTCDTAIRKIQACGFLLNAREEQRKNGIVCSRMHIAGGFNEQLRFLGTIRPERLLHNCFNSINEGTTATCQPNRVKILARENIGTKNVVDIKTSTGTFITEGFIVHNCGPAGQLLREVLRGTGVINRKNTVITHVVKCRPPGNKLPKGNIASICFSTWLSKEIEILQPKRMLLLGSVPLEFVAQLDGITRCRGTWIKAHGIRTMSTFHPSYIIRTDRDGMMIHRETFENDIKQVAEEVRKIEKEMENAAFKAC